MSGTITVGNFKLTGFDQDALDGTVPFRTDRNNPEYDFNYTMPRHGHPDGTPQVVLVDGGASDAWTFSVTLNSSNSFDELVSGTASVVGGPGNHTLTFSGSGSAALQATIQNLQVYGHAADTFSITFDLIDETTAGGGVVPSGQNNANEQTFTESFLACYVAGTRIATPSGETAVEALRIGDLVVTADGIAKPVKWIGRRAYTAAQIAMYKHLRPVIVRQGALAENMPHRDLMVSPIHSLFLDDVFIPAAALINGVSILRSEALEPVSYLHIELDEHDVVFAEGAPAETYVDDDSRLMFDNADEYYDMFGAGEMPRGFSAPRIEHGYQLDAIRRRLAARAGLPVAPASTGALKGHVERLEDGVLVGWVTDATAGAAPVELDVLVDDEIVARTLANRYRADLDQAGLAGGRCAFSVALPASAVSLAQIQVRRTNDGARVAMPEHAALTV